MTPREKIETLRRNLNQGVYPWSNEVRTLLDVAEAAAEVRRLAGEYDPDDPHIPTLHALEGAEKALDAALARLGEEEAAEQSHEAIVRTCRVCGCTDEWGCDGGCSWAKDDLCSECSPAEASDAALARLGEGE